jgi:hypothetical protein
MYFYDYINDPVTAPLFANGSPWTDSTYGNDVCPSVERPAPSGQTLRLWLDYADPADRENMDEDEPRFLLVIYSEELDTCHILGTSDTLAPLLKQADELAEVLKPAADTPPTPERVIHYHTLTDEEGDTAYYIDGTDRTDDLRAYHSIAAIRESDEFAEVGDFADVAGDLLDSVDIDGKRTLIVPHSVAIALPVPVAPVPEVVEVFFYCVYDGHDPHGYLVTTDDEGKVRDQFGGRSLEALKIAGEVYPLATAHERLGVYAMTLVNENTNLRTTNKSIFIKR